MIDDRLLLSSSIYPLIISLGFALTFLGGFLTEHEDYAEADDVLNKGEAIFGIV